MLQILQHQSTGEIVVADVPPPQCPEGGALISVACSLISAGTERTSVQKAQSSLVQRALKQPQEALKVLESVRKDGVAATFHKVQNTLDSYKPLGYSVAGTVVESRADGFLPGDRVACAGNAYAYHAELVVAPKNDARRNSVAGRSSSAFGIGNERCGYWFGVVGANHDSTR